jgi:hypothetical protein
MKVHVFAWANVSIICPDQLYFNERRTEIYHQVRGAQGSKRTSQEGLLAQEE